MFRHDNGVFTLKGGSSYAFINKLFVLLNGNRKVSEVCAQLDAGRAKHVVSLLDNLWSRGVLCDHLPESEDLLPQEVTQHFRRHLEFIEHFAALPVSRFKNYRSARILLYGEGEVYSALGASLLRNGLEQLHLASDESAADLSPLRAEMSELEASGIAARVISHSAMSPPLREFDLVAYGSSRPSLREVAALNESCRAAGVPFLPVIAISKQSYLGPLVLSGVQGCWCCALLRIASNASPEEAVTLWRSVAVGEPLANPFMADCSPAAQMLGNNAAFEIFKHRCAHLDPETAGGVVCQSLETLESRRIRLLPHVHCPVCGNAAAGKQPSLRDVVAAEAGKGEGGAEKLTVAWMPFIHPQLGVIQSLGGEPLPQIPLRTAAATLAVPGGAAAHITAYGFHTETTGAAMRSALVEAVRRYAGACPLAGELRRASYHDLKMESAEPVRPEQLLNWCGPDPGPDEKAYWLPAYSVLTQRDCLVPAGAVYPLSNYNRGSFRRLQCCATAGGSFTSMVDGGVTQALAYHRIASFEPGKRLLEYQGSDLAALDGDLEWMLASLARLGHSMRMMELCGSTPVRVVASSLADAAPVPDASVFGYGRSLRDAARMSLVNLVGACQMAQSPRALGYSLKDLMPHLPAGAFSDAQVGNPGEVQPQANEPAPELLLRSGLDALFVDITPADVRLTQTLTCGVFLLRTTPVPS